MVFVPFSTPSFCEKAPPYPFVHHKNGEIFIESQYSYFLLNNEPDMFLVYASGQPEVSLSKRRFLQ